MLGLLYFIIGTCFGSFCCVVAERLPQGRSIAVPASFCPRCRMPLSWREKIPVISILWLRFACRYCQLRIPAVYLWSELLAGGIFCFVGLHPRLGFFHLFWLLSALTLSLTDHFYFLVEPKIFYLSSALLIVLALIFEIPCYWLHPPVIFLLGFLLYRLMPDSFGGGDVLLLADWSLFLTTQETAFLVFFASLAGLCCFSLAWLNRRSLVELPFVPCLSVGLVIVLRLFF